MVQGEPLLLLLLLLLLFILEMYRFTAFVSLSGVKKECSDEK